MFVVRLAGNVANEDEIASIEYAVEHFNAPLVVVMGHSECGAVTAVIERAPMPKEIEHLVVHINDAMVKVRTRSPELSGKPLVAAGPFRIAADRRECLRLRHRQGNLVLKPSFDIQLTQNNLQTCGIL